MVEGAIPKRASGDMGKCRQVCNNALARRTAMTLQQSGPVKLTSPAPDASTLHQLTQPISDDTHDNDPPAYVPYTTSLQQRQQQAAEFFRQQHNYSRASSSEGSAAHSLRRTPNIEDVRQRFRSPSPIDPPPQPNQRTVRFAAEYPHLSPGPVEGLRARDSGPQFEFEPHPALRISQRTASAIRFVLEEAIRGPYPFTPDLAEENASMSDLTAGGNGRAANGGARTGGPVPVTQADRPNILTPQMIMNNRRQREARREAEEERKAQEERRRSAERRAQAAGVAGAPVNPDAGMQRQPQPQQTYDSGYGSYGPQGASSRQPIPPAAATLPPSGRIQDTASGAQSSRPRANSQSQQQPRPVQQPSSTAQPSSSRRPPPVQHSRNPSAPVTSAPIGSSAPPPAPPLPGASSSSQQRQSTTSNFPHAFERWETLSSHWEGLTSYWIRKLESNTDEMRNQPLVQQLSRQITDLSAAGANLFHAVVELQRLRASSERKFQRWFYDHRQEQERAQEREAQLETTIREERAARNQAVADMERLATEKRNAERSVQEMKRELQISKEEARRAWEELGRREQEERDRVFSLRDGQPTMIGGVQVLPTAQAMGRHGSVRSHGDDTYAGSSSGQGIEQHYTYEEAQSPTDTDPFTEGRHHEPEAKPVAQGTYVPSGAGPSSLYQPGYSQAAEQPQVPAPAHTQQASGGHQGPSGAHQYPKEPLTSQPEAFYQQPEAYLHRDIAAGDPEDERSAITSHAEEETSEGEDEYAIDENGNYILDAAGHRVPFRALRRQDSDEYDVQEDRRREIEHLQRYGSAAIDPSRYATTSSAGSEHHGGFPTSSAPDYSGSGYGSEWTGIRHHHPTRLSDVMEEDERSRTSPSRASQASRGWA
ncbi:uncharacterized protein N0V89_002023 [Didymosphaeria variabile]|uniref:Uncharacterized protein n=1 Tax=Didymosphaeria variabile TaxID=1932322 RepID=A0A9W8XSP9_9PLEO|nr:uncharacterized protein N0V89_002023 [Didymosphaeria variabile]KAJ4357448.1 hypothetical protein N0V89_002023 [Didymosphaeria variabile]